MRRFALCAALLCAPAFAQQSMVARNTDGDTMRLVDKPCTFASVLAHIQDDQRKHFRRAEARIGGKDWQACFVIIGDQVGVVYSDGDRGMIPAGAFSEEKRI